MSCYVLSGYVIYDGEQSDNLNIWVVGWLVGFLVVIVGMLKMFKSSLEMAGICGIMLEHAGIGWMK